MKFNRSMFDMSDKCPTKDNNKRNIRSNIFYIISGAIMGQVGQ